MIQFTRRLATLDKMLAAFLTYDGDAPPIDATADPLVNCSLANAFRTLLCLPDNAFRFAWLEGQCGGAKAQKRAAGGDPYLTVLRRWEQDLIDSEEAAGDREAYEAHLAEPACPHASAEQRAWQYSPMGLV
jgi:hypothetical protein